MLVILTIGHITNCNDLKWKPIIKRKIYKFSAVLSSVVSKKHISAKHIILHKRCKNRLKSKNN